MIVLTRDIAQFFEARKIDALNSAFLSLARLITLITSRRKRTSSVLRLVHSVTSGQDRSTE